MIRVRVQLTYRLVLYEIEIEASDQTDIDCVLGDDFLGKVIDKIQDFIDGHFSKVEGEVKVSHCTVDDGLRGSEDLCVCALDAKPVCEAIMELLLKGGFSFQVLRAGVEAAIMNVRGIDSRTVARWISVLVSFGYLQPVNKNVFQMNVVKVPHLASIFKTYHKPT